LWIRFQLLVEKGKGEQGKGCYAEEEEEGKGRHLLRRGRGVPRFLTSDSSLGEKRKKKWVYREGGKGGGGKRSTEKARYDPLRKRGEKKARHQLGEGGLKGGAITPGSSEGGGKRTTCRKKRIEAFPGKRGRRAVIILN